jgi:hypothetical protein
VKLALTARYGHRRQAGKRPKIKNLQDLLAELSTKTIWWRRLGKMLGGRPRDQSRQASLSLADIPDEIRGFFTRAVKAIGRLEEALKEHRDGKATVDDSSP